MIDNNTHNSGLYLSLSIWHPDCWGLESTDGAQGGMLGHGIYNTSNAPETHSGIESVRGLFTVYGDTTDEVESLIEAVDDSPFTESVVELKQRYGHNIHPSISESTTRELFIEYDPQLSMSEYLASRGFIRNEPMRIRDGREYWSVFFHGTREEAVSVLKSAREEMNAEIDVTSIRSSSASRERTRRIDVLSERQREVFEHTRERGYYEWPREVSTHELAADLGLSKTTLLEHLRKAESKLLDP